MLPPILEKLVLNGFAQYKIVNVAYGSFEEIKVPNGGLCIIVQIIWNNFINPIKDYNQGLTWGEYFRSCEYQLKLQSEGKVDYYQFRNKISWQNDNVNNPIVLDAVIDKVKFDKYFIAQPHPEPIIIPTYLTVQQFLQLTITRNAFVKMVGTYGLMTTKANQNNAPSGMKDSNVILDLTMTSLKGSVMNYVPPSFDSAGVTVANRKTNQYAIDISTAGGAGPLANYESDLQNLDTTSATSSALNPFTNFPLVSFGIVTINKTHKDKIMS